MKSLRPGLGGSIGELTAVASANFAVRGDLNEGANESSDDVLGRVVMVTVGTSFSSAAIVENQAVGLT